MQLAQKLLKRKKQQLLRTSSLLQLDMEVVEAAEVNMEVVAEEEAMGEKVVVGMEDQVGAEADMEALVVVEVDMVAEAKEPQSF